MSRVTDVQPQRKDPDRVSVFVDGKFWAGMSRNCFIELDLSVGQELSKEQLMAAEKSVDRDRALNVALKRISYSPVSEKKLREKLESKEMTSDAIDWAVSQVKKMFLLDDRELALNMAEACLERGGWRRKAQVRLQKAGIGRDDMEAALDQVFVPDREAQIAEKALVRKYPGRLDRPNARRARDFLARNGFGMPVIEQVITPRLLTDEEEAELHGPDEARQLLQRKYGLPVPRNDAGKAWAFLARRGFTPDVIRAALRDGD